MEYTGSIVKAKVEKGTQITATWKDSTGVELCNKTAIVQGKEEDIAAYANVLLADCRNENPEKFIEIPEQVGVEE